MMTPAFENLTHIAGAVTAVLRRGIDLIDREDKIPGAILLVGDHLPEFSRAELKAALRQISAINQESSLRVTRLPSGKDPQPSGEFPHKQKFRHFLKETRGLGESVIDSYVGFINGASNDLGESVPHILLAWNGAPAEIVNRLAEEMRKKGCNAGTINNRKVAMRAYLEMIAKYCLREPSNNGNSDKPENGSEQKVTVSHSNGVTLPITLDPPSPDEFKDAILKTRIAYITVYYEDGTRKVKSWRADNFKPSSNVIGNIRSRLEFRKKEWQKRDIVKVAVSIQKPQNRLSSPENGGGQMAGVKCEYEFLDYLQQNRRYQENGAKALRAKLRRVAKTLLVTITPKWIRSIDIEEVADELKRKGVPSRKPGQTGSTLDDCKTAMRRYREMCEEWNLR